MWQSDSFNIKLLNDIIIFFPVCWEVSVECWLGRSSLLWGSETKSQVNLTVKLISARGPLPGLSPGLAGGSAEGCLGVDLVSLAADPWKPLSVFSSALYVSISLFSL